MNHEWVIFGHVHITAEQAAREEAPEEAHLCEPFIACVVCERPFSQMECVLPCEEPVRYLPSGEPLYARDN